MARWEVTYSGRLELQSALTGLLGKRRFEIRPSRSAAGETHETSRKSRWPLIVALWPFSESVPPKGDFVPWGERLPRGGRYGI